jgi:hypothetical protein
MDFSATNQADAKCRIQKTDGRGLPVPTHSMNAQPDTKDFTGPTSGFSIPRRGKQNL